MVTTPPPSLRIIFLGTPEFAVPTLARLFDSRHEVVAVVTQPDRPRGRGQHLSASPVKELALHHAIPVLEPARLKDETFLAELGSFTPDLGVVAAYGKILPDAVLALPRFGLINVHASLLPRYRGAAPVHRAVMAGDRETGVTIMRVVRELDAGPMLASETRAIGPDETSAEVEHDLAEIGARLLVRVADDLAAGRACETPQDARLATYAPRLDKAEGLIDWREPAAVIHNKVRGLHPWPHAYTRVGGERVIVLRTAVAGPAETTRPGEVLEAGGERLRVATGEGSIAILEIQPEGRRPMTAREFLAGHQIEQGSVLG